MKKNIYLIRHSVRMRRDIFDSIKAPDSILLRNEKISLSPNGEKRAELLCNKSIFDNIDTIYCSNCVRTIQTAKYLMNRLNKNINLDSRLDERRVGEHNENKVKDWFEKQYLDPDYKTIGGESQNEVRKRVLEKIDEILKDNTNGSNIAIFSHGYAICFTLLNWAKLESIKDAHPGHALKIKYNDKTILDGRLNSPDVFKLTFDNLDLIDIEHITFDDIPYDDFMIDKDFKLNI